MKHVAWQSELCAGLAGQKALSPELRACRPEQKALLSEPGSSADRPKSFDTRALGPVRRAKRAVTRAKRAAARKNQPNQQVARHAPRTDVGVSRTDSSASKQALFGSTGPARPALRSMSRKAHRPARCYEAGKRIEDPVAARCACISAGSGGTPPCRARSRLRRRTTAAVRGCCAAPALRRAIVRRTVRAPPPR